MDRLRLILSHFSHWNPDKAVRRAEYAIDHLGADVNGGVVDGDACDTPLCRSPSVAWSELLIEKGAVARGRGDGSQSLLSCAVLFAEEPELIAWAAELEGLDELNQLDEWGRSLPCQAARNQDENGVRIVLEMGADPNLHDTSDRGTHPLMCALTNQSSSTKGDRGMEYLRGKLQLAA